MNYQHYADKVANELLQCSTKHFNEQVKFDDGLTPINEAKEITLWAKSIAASLDVIKEIEDDLSQIREIKEGIEQTAKDKPINDLSDKLYALVVKLPKPDDNIPTSAMLRLPDEINSFIRQSTSILSSIAEISGVNNELYLELSDFVVRVVLAMSIKYGNSVSDPGGVLQILGEVDSLKMSAETESRFDKNWDIIRGNLRAIESSKSSNGACYIATLVYGDYDAKEVRVLRHFRDEVLAKVAIGRGFINLYYACSPYLVSKLKNQILIQSVIRRLLNTIVEKISS